MKLTTFAYQDVEHIGIVLEDQVFDLEETRRVIEKVNPALSRSHLFDGDPAPRDMLSFLEQGEQALNSTRRIEDFLRRYLGQGDPLVLRNAAYHTSEIQWLAPIPRPPFIFGLTANCPAAWRKLHDPIPGYPVGLLRPDSTILGHLEPVTVPEFYPSFRWTIEMGVILGRGGKGISEEEAMDHVVGYACFNDMVSDHWKMAFPELAPSELVFRDLVVGSYYGRSTDGFAPFGPTIVTKEEVGDPYDLMMFARQNGVQRDRAHTGATIVSIERAIAELSRFMTLPTGAVIHMGTMGTDGYLVGEDERLDMGEYIEIEIERLGALRTPIVDQRPPLS